MTKMRRSTLAIVAGALAAGLMPDPVIQPSSWASENVVVPDGPFAGERWSQDEAPYAAEILDSLALHEPCNRVTVRKSAQTGLTLVGLAWLGYIASVAPADALVVQPTQDAHQRFNREKLQRLIDSSPAVKAKISPIASRSGEGSTSAHKRFPGGGITLGIASSAAALRSATVRYVMADEVDEYPADVDNQGDPMEMLAARQISFGRDGRWKRLEISTPTLSRLSRIDAAYDEGDGRQWVCPCPHCGGDQVLKPEQVRGAEQAPFNAFIVCEVNGCVITEADRWLMVGQGRWLAQRPWVERHRSYHVDALMSRLVTLDQFWAQEVASRENPQKRKAFLNLWCGQVYEGEGEAPAWQDLQRRAQEIDSHAVGEIPAWVLFTTAGVDVQNDRLEASLWGWGVGRTSALVEHRVFMGDSSAPDVWAELTAWWAEAKETRDGRNLNLAVTAVDSGFRPAMVHDWCRSKPGAIAVKGASTTTRTDWALSNPKTIHYTPRGKPSRRAGANRLVGTWRMKSEIYSALEMEGPRPDGNFPPGFAFLPTGAPDDLFQQIVSEQLVRIERKDGRVDYAWRPLPQTRNEVLDCAVYARAAAYHLGMEQWTTQQWQDMAARAGAEAAAAANAQLDLLQAVHRPPAEEQTTTKTDKAKAGGKLAARLKRYNQGS